MSEKPVLTREQYRYVKGCNRQKMEEFLRDFCKETHTSGYKEGYTNGYEQGYNKGYTEGVDAISQTVANRLIEKVETAVKNTSGIGEKRFDSIMASITEELTKTDGGTVDESSIM